MTTTIMITIKSELITSIRRVAGKILLVLGEIYPIVYIVFINSIFPIGSFHLLIIFTYLKDYFVFLFFFSL